MISCALSRGDLEQVARRGGGAGPQRGPRPPARAARGGALAGRGLRRARPDHEARTLADRYQEANAEVGHPLLTAMAARCRGWSATTPRRMRPSDAVDVQTTLGDRAETGRTRLLWGMRLRRAGRRVAAREQLRAAAADFAAVHHAAWQDRAATELAATGERLRSRAAAADAALTSQETRVALLVAQGLTNREVAAALFLSAKTVEHHLGAVLRKRGLRSRTELARDLAAQ